MDVNRRPNPSPAWLVLALTAASLAVCAWIAVTVNTGVAVIGGLGTAAALWLYASSTGGPPQLIPVLVRRRHR